MKVLIHVMQRLFLLFLLWILSFFVADKFINKDHFCATGDAFVYFFWLGLFYILFGVILLIEAYFLHKKKEKGCMIANIVMASPMLLFICAFVAIYI